MVASLDSVCIRQYRSKDHQSVFDLVVNGWLQHPEHQNHLDRVHSIQKSLEMDLGDVDGTYMETGGNFWVATVVENGEEVVVGSVGLEPRGQSGEGELRRMAVKDGYRRFGIGHQLITHLEDWAVTHGFHAIVLSTGAEVVDTCRFYLRSGYTKVKTESAVTEDEWATVYFKKSFGSV